MPPLRVLTRHVACGALLSVLGTGPASAQFLHTFTPDPPPIGDGIDYPRTINPARQNPGGGVAPDFFDTDAGTIFQNTNGNPAFFDASNLLTRPAARITNEAFWTDPKIGVFDSGLGFDIEDAAFGFQFSPPAGEDFGFDLAVASVSGPVPETLPFFIQNTNSPLPGVGMFELGLTPGSGDISPVESGTFTTLGSPFPGREARFRIPHSQIEALLGDSSPLLIFSIDLFDISTLGGTTQVALDNFVLAGANVLPNEPQREPVRFQSELIPPGELQHFVFDPLVSQETGIEVDLDSLPAGSLIELAARTSTPPGSALPEVENTVTFPDLSELDTQPSVSVSAPTEPVPPNVPSFVPPFVVPASGSVSAGAEAQATGSIGYVEGRSVLGGSGAGLSPGAPMGISIPEGSEAETALFNLVQSLADEATAAVMMSSAGNTGSRRPRGAGGAYTLYLNTSLGQYLAEKRVAGLNPVVGDTGGDLVPITDEDGQIVDFLARTWIVANGPGEYVPVLLVPEPGPAGMLVVGGLLMAAAAARRRRTD